MEARGPHAPRAGEVANARGARWAATMAGFPAEATPGATHPGALRTAHADSTAALGPPPWRPAPEGPGGLARTEREDIDDATLAPGATRAHGAGRRQVPEAPDPWRTCFERDRDRILHASAFRRLAGKTQVFVFPEDHQRTRLTHALEVAQVAVSIARACRLNVALTEAIALGHDCGHGPGGHASEDAFDPYLSEGFDHACWGADHSLGPLNLCAETLDGVRNHSWSRPAPASAEGEVVSWADRIAYVCHDWEDAVLSGIVAREHLPEEVRAGCGGDRPRQLDTFIGAVVTATLASGRVAMDGPTASALGAFRAANYEQIYLRQASRAQAASVIAVLRALVEHYADRPNTIPDVAATGGLGAGEPAAVRAAVGYVAGMTDRYAFRQAVARLDWDPDKLPRGIGE